MMGKYLEIGKSSVGGGSVFLQRVVRGERGATDVEGRGIRPECAQEREEPAGWRSREQMLESEGGGK